LQIENKTSKVHEADSSLMGKVVFFATNNIHKFSEARKVLAECGIAVGMLRAKAVEIQSDSLNEIAAESVLEVCRRCHVPVIVEDAGLFVESLNGFPGPYAAYVYKTLGNKGLLKLMENVVDRKAKFRSAIAFCNGNSGEVVCFEGDVFGTITYDERHGKLRPSFGFDPIFQPEGNVKTFAEMSLEEKNSISHRALAIRRFAEFYKKLYSSKP
jgi:XTP/dITP diphosphohydrolase